MKNTKTMTLPLFISLALSIIITTLSGCSSEPQKDGVPLKVWLKQLSSNEMIYRVEAAEAIGSMGSKARDRAEPMLTNLAGNDPMPRVRVAAILALKELGAPTTEFEEYLAEVTTPLNNLSQEDLAGTNLVDEMGEIDEKALFKGLAEDDLEFLQELENRVVDTNLTSTDVMPTDPEALKIWQDTRRKEQIDEIRQQFRNPEVLAELLATGDPLEKRFAAKLLGDKEGVSERVFTALTLAATDQDTLIRKLATEALKKWTKE